MRIYAAGARFRGWWAFPPATWCVNLQDMQPDSRKRIWTDPMRAVAGELTDEEIERMVSAMQNISDSIVAEQQV